MSGDRLARIEARDEDVPGAGYITLTPEERDALVEIAKAARVVQAYDQAGGNDWWEAHAKLYAALARLDSGAAEGDA